MNRLLSFLIIATIAFSVNAHNIKDYGAIGDGKHIDSDAINAAITDVASKGGGLITIPEGNYLCYSIRLQSNITIELEEGAVIISAPILKDGGFDLPEDNPFDKYQDFGHSHWKNSLIWGIGLKNVSICGKGLIDGSSLSRWDNGANKAISLRECQNVILKDFSVLKGGHFSILLTDVNSLLISGLKIDANRDAIDIDCCKDVVVEDCIVNSPWDDAIVLKSCYALGRFKDTENVMVSNCVVSGYDCGTMLDGTYQLAGELAPDGGGRTGRLKIGTESSGGFKNIVFSHCTFEHCRGIALETVDGGNIENVLINDITMNHIVNSPIFLRLGARLRSPEGTPVGTMKNIQISDIKASNVDSRYAITIAGIPGHFIENVALKNIEIEQVGGCKYTTDTILPEPPGALNHQRDTVYAVNPSQEIGEYENIYPEPWMFGVTHSKGFFIRHAKNISIDNVNFKFTDPDPRPYSLLIDTYNISGLDQ